jgi:hypothetical protein
MSEASIALDDSRIMHIPSISLISIYMINTYALCHLYVQELVRDTLDAKAVKRRSTILQPLITGGDLELGQVGEEIPKCKDIPALVLDLDR